MAPPPCSRARPAPASEATTWCSGETAMNRRPHFFQIFLPPYCSGRQLTIPVAFREHIDIETSGSIHLKGPSGNVWNADLVMNRDGSMTLQKGWEVFVRDHSLSIGDFLVFRYDGGLFFNVLVFDRTTCEKQEAFHATPCQDEEEVIILGERRRTSTYVDLKDPPEEHSSSDRTGPYIDDSSLNSDDSDTDYCCDDEAEESSLPTEAACSHRKRFRGEAQKPKAKRSAHKKKIRRVMKQPCCEIPGPSASPNIDNGLKVRRGDLQSCRRVITADEKAKAFRAAKLFQSNHPFCLSVMRPSYVYSGFFMCLPRHFVGLNLPKSSVMMKLWDPSNKPWQVMYVYEEDKACSKGAFSGGWRKFSRDNNLESDDVCVFELLKPCELRVHIFRVVEEITPLQRCSSHERKR